MKYKLINKTTLEEHLCEKVVIDGWDYYVSDEEPKRKSICIAKTNAVYQNNQQSLNNKLVFLDKEVVNKHEIIGRVEFGEDAINLPFDVSELKKVIATNNPDIDIPQILEEPSQDLIHQIAADLGYRMIPKDLEEGIKAGYKESQETHPNSDDDMIEFNEWCNKSYEFDNRCNEWFHGNGYYTTKELLQLWKEQRTKTLYYE